MSDIEGLWDIVEKRLADRREGCAADDEAADALRRLREHYTALGAAARIASAVGPEQRATARAEGYAAAKEQAVMAAESCHPASANNREWKAAQRAITQDIRAMQDGQKGEGTT